MSAAEQNKTSMIELIEVGARRSVRGMPVPARALAPQPLPHVLSATVVGARGGLIGPLAPPPFGGPRECGQHGISS